MLTLLTASERNVRRSLPLSSPSDQKRKMESRTVTGLGILSLSLFLGEKGELLLMSKEQEQQKKKKHTHKKKLACLVPGLLLFSSECCVISGCFVAQGNL